MANQPELCGMCGKVCYKKKTQAFAYALKYEIQFDKKTRTYKCELCPRFLLTTKPLKHKQEKEKI